MSPTINIYANSSSFLCLLLQFKVDNFHKSAYRVLRGESPTQNLLHVEPTDVCRVIILITIIFNFNITITFIVISRSILMCYCAIQLCAAGPISSVLLKANLSQFEENECNRLLSSSGQIPRGIDGNSMICAGERDGSRDTCQVTLLFIWGCYWLYLYRKITSFLHCRKHCV